MPVRGRAGQGAPAITWVGRRSCNGDSEKFKDVQKAGLATASGDRTGGVTERAIEGAPTPPAGAAAWRQALK